MAKTNSHNAFYASKFLDYAKRSEDGFSEYTKTWKSTIMTQITYF